MRKALAVATLCLIAGTLNAQDKPSANRNARQGFFIGFGLGGGSAGVDCPSCGSDRLSGFSGNFHLGGTLSQSLLLGFESNGWLHSEGGVDDQIGFGSAVLYWYPSRTGAFYLKFGLGGMYFKESDGTDELTATAPAGSFGLGYDIRVSRNMSITPYLNSLATSAASFKINGQAAPTNEDVKINLVQLGVGLSWH